MNQNAQDDNRYKMLRKIPVFRLDKWYSGGNYYVYRINYKDNDNYKMFVYIFDEIITYLYMNHTNHVCDYYKAIR